MFVEMYCFKVLDSTKKGKKKKEKKNLVFPCLLF